MQFNSAEFMLFFPVAIFVYFVVPKKFRSVWLLAASYYFYMGWNYKYIVLILFSTVVTFASALVLEKCQTDTQKKFMLFFALASNLALLALFKYANFFIANVNRVLNFTINAELGWHFKYALPVGISFYTFQALGYIIDVYRGDIKAEKNFITYALFVSFFPQLVAGPIERSKNLLGQFQKIKKINLWNLERFSSGAILMIYGFFLKMVIADRIAVLVDFVFDGFTNFGTVELVAAAIGFAFQIYCDFASYSMIAIGAAKIMGFSLMENFNTPYFALSVSDFWRRWHISLSSWFRDYVYFPLGGNKKGKMRTYLNKMTVFILSGVWHGAAWHFVAWGFLHGSIQVFSDVTKTGRTKIVELLKIKTEVFSWKFLKVATTFVFVCLAWIFFRANSLKSAVKFILRIFKNPNPWILFNGGIYNLGLDRIEMNILFFALLFMFAVEILRYKQKVLLDKFLLSQNLWFSWAVSIALIVVIIIFGRYGFSVDLKEFIYFQF